MDPELAPSAPRIVPVLQYLRERCTSLGRLLCECKDRAGRWGAAGWGDARRGTGRGSGPRGAAAARPPQASRLGGGHGAAQRVRSLPASLPLPRAGTALCPLALPPAPAAPLHRGSGRGAAGAAWFGRFSWACSWGWRERELGESDRVERERWQHATRMLPAVSADYAALCKITKARSLGPLAEVSLFIRVGACLKKRAETGPAHGQEPRSNRLCAKTRGRLAGTRKSHQPSSP